MNTNTQKARGEGKRKTMNHGANVTEQTDSRVGGGGAATSAGIQFEQRLGALIGSWLLNQQPMPAFLGLGDAVPV